MVTVLGVVVFDLGSTRANHFWSYSKPTGEATNERRGRDLSLYKKGIEVIHVAVFVHFVWEDLMWLVGRGGLGGSCCVANVDKTFWTLDLNRLSHNLV